MALDNHTILLIEQGEDKNDAMRNLIYRVDLSKASDLAAFDKPGEYPEFDDEKTLAQRGITLAEKRRWSICVRWAGSRKRPKGWR